MRLQQAWLPTLFILAAICLLPAWVVGGAALGAAATIWGHGKWKRSRIAKAKAEANERELERTARQIEKGYRPLSFEEVDELLYQHEKPFYAYCASGAGHDPREDPGWVLKREVLKREWARQCPYGKVVPISKARNGKG